MSADRLHLDITVALGARLKAAMPAPGPILLGAKPSPLIGITDLAVRTAADRALVDDTRVQREGELTMATRRFTLHLTDGRTWAGVEFPSGHVAVNHPDERDWFTVATSTDGLLNDLHPQHPMSGARIEWTDTDGPSS